jgi:hypothetical protein
MRIALMISAILATGISPAQDNAWSLELLERYASWVRESGFSCSLATRVTEVGPDGGGTAFKVTCAPAATPVTGEEVAFRLTVRPDGSRRAEPWQE